MHLYVTRNRRGEQLDAQADTHVKIDAETLTTYWTLLPQTICGVMSDERASRYPAI